MDLTGTLAILAVVALGLVLAVRYHRRHHRMKRLRVVAPGQIYRAAMPRRRPYERFLRRHGIRTIVTLLHEQPDAPREVHERELAARLGLDVVRIPMPGTGLASDERLLEVAAVLADRSRYPIFLHCVAGSARSGISVAVWRYLHCGWSIEAAASRRGDRAGRLTDKPELLAHFRAFCSRHPPRPTSSP
jgi:protein tyrosine/serine phosphatase